MEIIPVINCHTSEEVAERVKKANKFADWVHLDVSDARFTFNKSWGDSSAWAKMGNKANLEVHLMVEEPEKYVDGWVKAGAKRLIVHLEALNEKTFLEIKKKTGKKAELMLAVNPETPANELKPYFKEISSFQILAVYPGPSGQKFRTLVTDKIKFLRREMPDATIEIDGGINEETAKLAKSAGADIVSSGSYIFNSPDPSSAYEKLKSI
ncbi:MAG: ribulose-phosphate 3-epimerase [Patescibacteria group bacterium]